MLRQAIPTENFTLDIIRQFDKQWFLLTGGDYGKGSYNSMTVSWGSIGNLWDKPFVQVFVRPTRFTFQFMEQSETFTLSAFPRENHQALNLLGTKSGREGDKIGESKLTPVASKVVAAPSYDEAELVIECRKMYWQDLEPANFVDKSIHKNYPEKEYHRVYFGEIVAVFGTPRYLR